uniref:Uncharacterized protein n=1 Tax=Mimivirus LCMiAC01 TaxID=2506608 RepID=A0A481YZJ5_9VIRU|nr:MAG: hypothetical protein LCMiAC01_02760 [Mimivirus LCMiAC01]
MLEQKHIITIAFVIIFGILLWTWYTKENFYPIQEWPQLPPRNWVPRDSTHYVPWHIYGKDYKEPDYLNTYNPLWGNVDYHHPANPSITRYDPSDYVHPIKIVKPPVKKQKSQVPSYKHPYARLKYDIKYDIKAAEDKYLPKMKPMRGVVSIIVIILIVVALIWFFNRKKVTEYGTEVVDSISEDIKRITKYGTGVIDSVGKNIKNLFGRNQTNQLTSVAGTF